MPSIKMKWSDGSFMTVGPTKSGTDCGCGCGLGGLIATYISWITNHSILWAIFHGFCGWFYVIYWFLVHNK